MKWLNVKIETKPSQRSPAYSETTLIGHSLIKLQKINFIEIGGNLLIGFQIIFNIEHK